MGSRRRTTTVSNTVVNAPTASVVNVVSGSVGQINNTVVNSTTIINQAPPVILPPPAQRAITSSSAISAPSVTTIGNTVIRSVAPDLSPVSVRYSTPNNVWSNVPFVTTATPTATVTVVNSPNIDVGVQVSDARGIRTDLCDSLTNDPTSGSQDFTLTGNGGATNFRFPFRGAPSNVVVINLSTGATVAGNTYTVVVRTDSFSWLRFDTAPADGISFKVTFEIGDSGTIRTVDAGSWNNWQALVRELTAKLNSIKAATATSTHVGANSVTTWNAGDPTLIIDAQNAVNSLQRAIKRPGMRMDVGQVAGICDYLDKQLSRIDSNLNRVAYVGGVRVGTTTVTSNTDSSIAGRIYQNDIRYTYFVGPASAAQYIPPNATTIQPVTYRRLYDSVTGRFYYVA